MKKNLLIFIALVVGITGYYLIDYFQFDGEVELETNWTATPDIKVYITGEVAFPGVYELSAQARLEDLLAAAGGVTEAANLRNLNLAMRLEDGDKVVVPALQDEAQDVPLDLNTMSAEDFMEIESIGEVTAKRIVDYRESKGYLVLEDLIEVEGIGEQKLQLIREYLEN